MNGAVDGSTLYNELLKEVDDAKARQTNASERLTDAIDAETEAYKRLADAIKTASDAAANTGRTGLVIPSLPTVPTPRGATTGTGTTTGGGATVNVYPGIGTNGPEAARQIAELLKNLAKIDPNSVGSFVGAR